jgi:hypothetical protein
MKRKHADPNMEEGRKKERRGDGKHTEVPHTYTLIRRVKNMLSPG